MGEMIENFYVFYNEFEALNAIGFSPSRTDFSQTRMLVLYMSALCMYMHVTIFFS